MPFFSIVSIIGLIASISGECTPKSLPKLADCNMELITIGGKCLRETNIGTLSQRHISVPPDECWKLVNEKGKNYGIRGKRSLQLFTVV